MSQLKKTPLQERLDRRAAWDKECMAFYPKVKNSLRDYFYPNQVNVFIDTPSQLQMREKTFIENYYRALPSFYGNDKLFSVLKQTFEDLHIREFETLINLIAKKYEEAVGEQPVDVFKRWLDNLEADSTFQTIPLEWQIVISERSGGDEG